MPRRETPSNDANGNDQNPFFFTAVWDEAGVTQVALLNRLDDLETARKTLTNFSPFLKNRNFNFEIDVPNRGGGSKRAGIPSESWSIVTKSCSEVFLKLSPLGQVEGNSSSGNGGGAEPFNHVHRQGGGKSGTASVIKSGTSCQTAASKGEGSGGGVLRSSRKKHRSRRMPSRPHKGGRRQNKRNNAEGTTPCQQCIGYDILCELQTRTAFICLNCKTYGLPCSNKPVDIGEIEQSLRYQQSSSDTGSLMSSIIDSETAGSVNGRGSVQASASAKEDVSDSEGENEFEELD